MALAVFVRNQYCDPLPRHAVWRCVTTTLHQAFPTVRHRITGWDNPTSVDILMAYPRFYIFEQNNYFFVTVVTEWSSVEQIYKCQLCFVLAWTFSWPNFRSKIIVLFSVNQVFKCSFTQIKTAVLLMSGLNNHRLCWFFEFGTLHVNLDKNLDSAAYPRLNNPTRRTHHSREYSCRVKTVGVED